MANILATQSAEMRAKGQAMIQQADRLLCESWNERMWSDGETSPLSTDVEIERKPRSEGSAIPGTGSTAGDVDREVNRRA
jgi:hypothetical protein